MSKRPFGKSTDPKSTQADIPIDTQKKNTNQLIEIAAEQLADLLWKTWLYKKRTVDRRKKEKFSLKGH